MAWLTAVPPAGPGERQYRGIAGGGRAKPQTVAGSDEVGTATRAPGELAGPASSTTSFARGRLLSGGASSRGPARADRPLCSAGWAHAQGLFQHAGILCVYVMPAVAQAPVVERLTARLATPCRQAGLNAYHFWHAVTGLRRRL